MNKKTNIEQQVMASVAVIYAARTLTSRRALELYALFLSCAAVSVFVSVPHVISNFEMVMRGGFPSVVTFLVAAITGTKLLVQVALVVGAAGVVSLLSSLVARATSARSSALA